MIILLVLISILLLLTFVVVVITKPTFTQDELLYSMSTATMCYLSEKKASLTLLIESYQNGDVMHMNFDGSLMTKEELDRYIIKLKNELKQINEIYSNLDKARQYYIKVVIDEKHKDRIE